MPKKPSINDDSTVLVVKLQKGLADSSGFPSLMSLACWKN